MAKSPFPGMDPFIEANDLWRDFHAQLIGEIDRALAAQVPDRYVVRCGERAYIVMSDGVEEELIGMEDDVGLTVTEEHFRQRSRRRARAQSKSIGTAVTEEPMLMTAMITNEFRETFVDIREADGRRRLVTSIEVLSPTNKRSGSPGWDQYVRKRQAFLGCKANFIEIDLLRRGRRMPMKDDWPASPYYLLVARSSEAPRCVVWPGHSLRPLPVIPVPLLAPDPDVSLDFQPMVQAIYTRSHYEQDIDYHDTNTVRLNQDETKWLASALRKSGRSRS